MLQLSAMQIEQKSRLIWDGHKVLDHSFTNDEKSLEQLAPEKLDDLVGRRQLEQLAKKERGPIADLFNQKRSQMISQARVLARNFSTDPGIGFNDNYDPDAVIKMGEGHADSFSLSLPSKNKFQVNYDAEKDKLSMSIETANPIPEHSRLNRLSTYRYTSSKDFNCKILGQAIVNFINYLKAKGLDDKNTTELKMFYKQSEWDDPYKMELKVKHSDKAFEASLKGYGTEDIGLEITEDFKLKVKYGRSTSDFFILDQDGNIESEWFERRREEYGVIKPEHIATMLEFFKPIAQAIQDNIENEAANNLAFAKDQVRAAIAELDSLVAGDNSPKQQYFNPIETTHTMSLPAMKAQVLKEDREIREWIESHLDEGGLDEMPEHTGASYHAGFRNPPFAQDYPNVYLSVDLDADKKIRNYTLSSEDHNTSGKRFAQPRIRLMERGPDPNAAPGSEYILKQGRYDEILTLENFGDPDKYWAKYVDANVAGNAYYNWGVTPNKHDLDTWLNKVLRPVYVEPDDELLELQGLAIYKMLQKTQIDQEQFQTLRYDFERETQPSNGMECFRVRSRDHNQHSAKFSIYFDGPSLMDEETGPLEACSDMSKTIYDEKGQYLERPSFVRVFTYPKLHQKAS